jgi:hypothetical protein
MLDQIRCWIGTAVVLLSVLVTVGSSLASEPNGPSHFFEARLGPMPDPNVIGEAVRSPDNRHVAIQELTKSGGSRLIVDGQPGPEYEQIRHPTFSPDGEHLACMVKKDQRWSVVVDGQPGPQIDWIMYGIVFSADSRHVAYGARKDNKEVIVIDGQPGPQRDIDLEGQPVLSRDGQRLAYATWTDKGLIVVSDGHTGPVFDEIARGSIVFSPDNRRLAYTALKDKKWSVVVDGRPGEEEALVKLYVEFMFCRPVFSADSRHIAYGAKKGDGVTVVLDDQPGPQFDDLADNSLTFSPDSKRVAYARTGWSFWTARLGQNVTGSALDALSSAQTASTLRTGPRRMGGPWLL